MRISVDPTDALGYSLTIDHAGVHAPHRVPGDLHAEIGTDGKVRVFVFDGSADHPITIEGTDIEVWAAGRGYVAESLVLVDDGTTWSLWRAEALIPGSTDAPGTAAASTDWKMIGGSSGSGGGPTGPHVIVTSDITSRPTTADHQLVYESSTGKLYIYDAGSLQYVEISTGGGGAQGPKGDPGQDGADGDSAYQVAVSLGFTGTEQEWLDSLVGPEGPQGPQGDKGDPGTGGGGATAPPGTLIDFAGPMSNMPSGYLNCDGSEQDKTTYADLYAAIGDQWGTATDPTKFVLPDLSGRTTAAAAAGRSVGTLFGSADAIVVQHKHTATSSRPTFSGSALANHDHGTSAHHHAHGHTHTTNPDSTNVNGGVVLVNNTSQPAKIGPTGSNLTYHHSVRNPGAVNLGPKASGAPSDADTDNTTVNVTTSSGGTPAGTVSIPTITVNNTGSAATDANYQPTATVLKLIKT